MSRIKTYIDETVNELTTKVSWPTWSELQASAVVVMIASIIIAMVVWAMDYSFSNLMEAFYKMIS